jgi:sugar lactone lactonase YvrE
MLFRKHIVSMRTLLALTVALTFFVGGVGAALAANSGAAPVLVPYTVNALAGNEQPTTSAATALPAAGYGGDGKTGLLTTLNSPAALAVDSAGNIYWADTSSAIIRELNVQTGIVNTIAGVPPSNCSGYQNTSCSKTVIGCSEAIPALNDPIGGNIKGLAVDENDNVYFSDSSQFTISVIYHAGARVAAFIQLVDPTGVTKAGGVIPGYVYHIAGTVNLSSCVGTKGSTAAVDNVIAYQSGALANSSGQIALDGAGNLYIQDVGNNVVRVINTQTTPQQFFQYVVQPGFIRSIVDCSGALTVLCPGIITPTAGTGITFPANTPQNPSNVIDGPANALTYNTQTGMGVDAYGNVYQVNNKNATPGIYGSVSMAGGAPLGHYLSLLWPGINIAYGDSYEAAGDISRNDSLLHYYDNILANAAGSTGGTAVVRPTNITADPMGNIWVYDNHWPAIFRYDVNSGILLDVVGFGGSNGSGTTQYDVVPNGRSNYNTGTYGSNSVPTWCIEGPAGTTPFGAGPQTFDGRLDGCPAKVSTTSGNGELISDGYGNIFNAETSNNEIREFSEDNVFPATAIGGKVTQAIDVHFDASNQPTVLGVATKAFSFAPGNTDFSIDTTDPEFQALLWVHAAYAIQGAQNFNGGAGTTSTIAMYAGAPSCIQNAGAVGDASWDCLVYVTFSPTAAGLRQTQLVATTANGSVYYFPLIGTGTGGQLSIDGGQQIPVPATGLGTTSSVAVASNGNIYIADPANNRIEVCTPGSGSLCNTQTPLALAFPTTVTPTTLSGPMGVAVDAGSNIYISDTGNNRILEVNPVTNAVTVLGGIAWVSCQPTQTAGLTTPASPCPVIPAGAAPPANANLSNPAVTAGPIPVYNPLQQYLFKAPQGLAVDLNGNVYVADTGNSAIVEIPKNPVLGGANPLFQYAGAPTFVTPVAVAVDLTGNIYVADTGNPFQQVVKISPGGGDMQNLLPLGSHLPLVGGQGISTPNGVAVDGGGDVFISDSSANVVWEAPAAGPPNGAPFTLSFTGLSSPAGLALDANGNLYVADSGNKQILYVNRQNPTGNFGTVPEGLDVSTGLGMITGLAGTPVGCLQNGSSTPCTGYLTVTNSGNQPLTITEPISTITPSGTAFAFTNTCTSTPLLPGATCTISPTFQPTSTGAQSATLSVNGTQSVALVANGGQPQAKIVLTGAYSGGTPTAGGTATLTATVSQPHVPPGGTPSGTVTFVVTVDNGLYASGTCGANPVIAPVTLVGGVATTTINLAQGRVYSVVATYNGDSADSSVSSTPLPIVVPPIAITATAASLAFTYGVKPAAITGTISGVDASVTATLTSQASQYSPVSGSPYPITVAFTGGDFCNYGNPPVYNPGTTTQAVVTESPAALTDTLPAFTSVYGAPDINYALQLVYVGAVNGDQNKFSATFTPPRSSLLSIAGSPYTVVPTFSGKPISPFDDYKVTVSNGTLTITQAPSSIAATLKSQAVLDTTAALAAAPITLAVSTAVAGGIGVPTGTVTVYDTITTIIPTAPGLGAVIPPCSSTVTSGCNAPVTVTLTNGLGTFTPTITTPGLHQFSYSYSGDANFQGSVLNPPPVTPTTPACAPAALIASCMLVDTADFALTSSTGVLPIVPGVTPSGNGLLSAPGQNSTYPESASITVNGLLSETGLISLTCLPIGNPNATTLIANTTSGSAILSGVSNTSGLTPGYPVSGAGIPSGATITAVGATSITISANATATATGVTVSYLVPAPANAGTASSYIQCAMTPPAVTLTASGTSAITGTATTVLSVFTPVTEPLGYKYFGSVRMPGSGTMLAFLPLGVLAFCMRRRRRLSKVLWMLFAIAVVTAGMSGCGGNQVDFYSPIPQGPQYVQITATGNSITAPNASETRTFLVQIYID